MFIGSMWDVKELTHYSKRVGREVPGVVAILCEWGVGKAKVIYLAWDLGSRSYITLHFRVKAVERKKKRNIM